MTDLLLTILPRYTTYSDPPAGISIIHAVAKQAGFESKVEDFNLLFYKKMKAQQDQKMLERIDAWMEISPSNPGKEKILSENDRNELDKIYSSWLDIIEKHNPKFVGFSVFTQWSIKPALEFIPMVKKRFPHINIILGGPGTTPKNDKLFDIVDYYVDGEGENTILEILNGNGDLCPGVNGNPPVQIDDMNIVPFPDYSDYNLDDYICKGKMLRITGSRGCIRRCNFCDIYKQWPMFRWRNGNVIADEIFHQWSTLPTKPDMFLFTDSLLNGNMKMLRGLCERLIELKNKNPEFEPQYQSFFITSSPKFMNINDWDLLEQSGCHTMAVGIESGSEKVRWAMNKKVKNEWIDFFIEQAYNHNINMRWMLIIGFPEETDEDFFETVKLCEKYAWMNKKEDFFIHVLPSEFTLYEIDWLINNREDIHYDSNNHWYYNKNPSLSKEKRLARLFFLQKKLAEWNYGFRITSMIAYMENFNNLEEIYIDRYGIEMFGNYDLYIKYKNDLEKKYGEYND